MCICFHACFPQIYKEIVKEVDLSLCLSKHHSKKAYGEVKLKQNSFLALALGWGECLPSRCGNFATRERASSIYWIRGWVGYRASLDTLEK